MDNYELMLVVNAGFSQEEKEAVYKEASDVLVKAGAQGVKGQVWLEKHRITFKMRGCHEGTYYLITFDSERAAIARIRESIRLNERIMRYLILRVEKPAIIGPSSAF